MSTLPKTFQDAIVMARRLGARYIWIDSLCIFQDSRDDWLRESSAMCDIYTRSQLNIACTAAQNSDEGCFRDRDPSLLQPCVVSATWTGLPELQFLVLEDRFWADHLLSLPLLRRAWVIQERVLAPRVLHFGQAQCFWECRSKNACETYPNGMPASQGLTGFPDKEINFSFGRNRTPLSPDPTKRGNSSPGAYVFWNKWVQEYSTCGLTDGRDKLVALTGIARLVERVTGDVYVAGRWKSQLPMSLEWFVSMQRYPGVSLPRRPSAYRAPSWSWAALDAPIDWIFSASASSSER